MNAAVQFHLVDDADGTLDPARRAVGDRGGRAPLPAGRARCASRTPTCRPAACRGPPARLAAIAACGVPVHLDGARLFNAEVATGDAGRSIAAPATTVMCCLSKGLAAPVGSLLAGPADVIDAARQERKRLGGAMRQAGVIAAAGLVAPEPDGRPPVPTTTAGRGRSPRRWPTGGPHSASTRRRCAPTSSCSPTPTRPRSSRTSPSAGIRAGTIAPGVMRLMTHLDVDDAGVDRTVDAIRTRPEERAASAGFRTGAPAPGCGGIAGLLDRSPLTHRPQHEHRNHGDSSRAEQRSDQRTDTR